MADEMYIEKGTQYHSGNYIGADDKGALYKGIVAFMIVDLRKNIPYIVKASPEVTISGPWLANEIEICISLLSNAGFNTRGVVTDNHSCNVNAFSILRKSYNSQPEENFINHPANMSKIYLFYDCPHLVKNIRNNLLHAKRFVFPAFSHTISDGENINVPVGYLSWGDLHNIHDENQKLPANLRKAPKLSYKSLHPGNNKQSVALAIFDPTTIVGARILFPEREDLACFLELKLKWWTIINANSQYTPNKLGNAFTHGDGKPEFLKAFANYLADWSASSNFFCLTKQTSDAMIRTLRAQAQEKK